MNNSYLGGRVESDVETHRISDTKFVANFTMSTKHRDKLDFHRVAAWGEAARIASLLRKGDMVMVEGRMQARMVNDHREVEVVAWTIYPVKGRVDMDHDRAVGDE